MLHFRAIYMYSFIQTDHKFGQCVFQIIYVVHVVVE